jgi:hypothetical protein
MRLNGWLLVALAPVALVLTACDGSQSSGVVRDPTGTYQRMGSRVTMTISHAKSPAAANYRIDFHQPAQAGSLAVEEGGLKAGDDCWTAAVGTFADGTIAASTELDEGSSASLTVEDVRRAARRSASGLLIALRPGAAKVTDLGEGAACGESLAGQYEKHAG